MIPKIIHYCWFGKNPKPDIILQCINSWKVHLPDWEIKEWNESNFDVSANTYMKEAYDAKKWAFVSDVARLMIVYTEGGFYFDTDVELQGSINYLLANNAVFIFETERRLSSGLGFGAIQGHPAIGEMLMQYKNKHFIVNGKMRLLPCPKLNTDVLRKMYCNLVMNNQSQILSDTYFMSSGEYSKIMKHYGTASWVEGDRKKGYVYKDSKLKRILRNPMIFEWIENSMSDRTVDIYTFLVYDLLEFGIIYYVKRLYKKRKG